MDVPGGRSEASTIQSSKYDPDNSSLPTVESNISASRNDVNNGKQQKVLFKSDVSIESEDWKGCSPYMLSSLSSEAPTNLRSPRFSCISVAHADDPVEDPLYPSHPVAENDQRISSAFNPLETTSTFASLEKHGYDVKYPGPLLKLNISGTIFLVKISTLRQDPLVFEKILEDAEYIPENNEYYFERDPVIFRFVHAYLRHQEMHLPMNICGPLMEKELEAWGLQLGLDLQRCCLGPVMATKSRMESLRKFEESFSESPVEYNYTSRFCIQWQKLRQYVWRIITDTPKKRWLGLLLSQSSPKKNGEGDNVDDSTSVSRRNVVFDVTHTRALHGEILDPENHCEHSGPDENTLASENDKSSGRFNWRTLQKTPREIIFGRIYVSFQFLVVMFLMIYMTLSFIPNLRELFGPKLNISDFNQAGFPQIPVHRSYHEFDDETRQMTQPILVLRVLTWICVVLFTIDLIARGIFCPRFLNWLLSFYTITDIISLLPFYVEEIILSYIGSLSASSETDSKVKNFFLVIDIFNMFKVFVICRIFRLLQRQRATRVLIYTIRTAATNMVMVFELMLLCAVLFGTSIFFFDENISSIFIGIWWAFTTMTTVGYGDVIPTSTPGRVIAMLCMVIGILLTSYTIPVLVNDFLLFYGHADQLAWMRRVHKTATVKRRKENRDLMAKRRIKQVRALIKQAVIGMGSLHDGFNEQKTTTERITTLTYPSNSNPNSNFRKSHPIYNLVKSG
ncbi:hypothetical protein Aperf_G00000042198 [Anoplocephala perfoliata]